MKPTVTILFLAVLVGIPRVFPQAVPRELVHERILCVVPMVGKGTWEDPRKPMFAPTRDEVKARQKQAKETSGKDRYLNTDAEILGYRFQVSDDGEYALVEFYASDTKAFKKITAKKDSNIKVFRRGQAKKADIEREFKKHKKDFSWDTFLNGGQP